MGNSGEQAWDRTQSWVVLSANLTRVNEAAKRSRQTRFTALLHHADVAAFERAYRRLRRQAAPGVDGVTVESYGQDLEGNLRDLADRVHGGRYRPLPVRRTYIPKADGGQRPLGILALEDKIVQGAVAEVLSAIYEVDFLDCSYGFRPGRSAHKALRMVREAITTEPVNWVLDADIRRYFDSVDHDWLLRMLAHRIADPRVLRLISQWLRAGILEGGVYADTVEGTPQGAGISPLLANIFLHYVLDLWVEQWKRRHATGHVRLVRYADDYLLMFQRRHDAETMTAALAERLAKFGLHPHEDKTRLIEFGRFAEKPSAQGQGTAGGVRLPGLHALLRQDQGRTLSPLPEDPREADDPQAEGVAPGDEATDAPTAPQPAQVAGRGTARALRLLRHPRQ
jgi:RNA-directed DNA polymerase